jgi:lipid II:glycine glycyltransferase (peptidoglycan interpeptide bridge formation enzyme)
MAPAPPRPQQLTTDDAAWDDFVRSDPRGSFLQLSGWAVVKAASGWRSHRVVVDGGSGPIGVQLLIRRLGPGPFAVGYAPRGPLGAADPASLAALTEALRRMARRERLSHVTLEPPWPATTPDATDGADPSTATVPVLRDDPAVGLGSLGWIASDPVQHDRTRVVDLTDHDRMWQDVRPRSRRYVNAARKAGITVTREDRRAIPEFHGLLAATAERAGFFAREAGSYGRILDVFGDDAWMLMARTPDGSAVAGLQLVRCGDTVAEPSGGMDDTGASTRANYLLKWQSMVNASEAGATRYDMWGIAHGGIEQFKAGFGGIELGYPGAFDLQTLPLLRPTFLAARRTWVRVARRRSGLDRPTGPPSTPRDTEPAP